MCVVGAVPYYAWQCARVCCCAVIDVLCAYAAGSTPRAVHVPDCVQHVPQGAGHPGQQHIHRQPHQLLRAVPGRRRAAVLRWLPCCLPPCLPGAAVHAAGCCMVLPVMCAGMFLVHHWYLNLLGQIATTGFGSIPFWSFSPASSPACMHAISVMPRRGQNPDFATPA